MGLRSHIKWADGFVLMYSISDLCSFNECSRLKFLINYSKRRKKSKVCLLFVSWYYFIIWYRILCPRSFLSVDEWEVDVYLIHPIHFLSVLSDEGFLFVTIIGRFVTDFTISILFSFRTSCLLKVNSKSFYEESNSITFLCGFQL